VQVQSNSVILSEVVSARGHKEKFWKLLDLCLGFSFVFDRESTREESKLAGRAKMSYLSCFEDIIVILLIFKIYFSPGVKCKNLIVK